MKKPCFRQQLQLNKPQERLQRRNGGRKGGQSRTRNRRPRRLSAEMDDVAAPGARARVGAGIGGDDSHMRGLEGGDDIVAGAP